MFSLCSAVLKEFTVPFTAHIAVFPTPKKFRGILVWHISHLMDVTSMVTRDSSHDLLEGRGSMVLQNVGFFPHNYTATQPRRP
jgi:hypothetical protein